LAWGLPGLLSSRQWCTHTRPNRTDNTKTAWSLPYLEDAAVEFPEDQGYQIARIVATQNCISATWGTVGYPSQVARI